MRNAKQNTTFYFLLCWAALATLCRPAYSFPIPFHDVDSLVYMSSDIVDAELISPTFAKVSLAYKGPLKAGESIKISSVEWMRISSHGQSNSRRLGAGDQVTLFLTKGKDINGNGDVDGYNIPPSGVMLRWKGRVYQFQQYRNPGPEEVYLQEGEAQKQNPTFETFRQNLTKSLWFVKAVTPLLKKKPIQADAPRLLNLLRQRAFPASFSIVPGLRNLTWWDIIGGKICQQIVSLRDPNAVIDAMAVVGPEYPFTNALRNEAGRKLIFQTIRDKSQSEARRIACAFALNGVYCDAYETDRDKANADAATQYDTSNACARQIITLMLETHNSAPVTTVILSMLDALAPYSGMTAEIKAQAVSMQKLYQSTDSGTVRFWMGKLFFDALGKEAVINLDKSCGPMWSLAVASRRGDSPGTLLCSSRWFTLDKQANGGTPLLIELFRNERQPDAVASLILQSVQTGERYTLPRHRGLDWQVGKEWIFNDERLLPASLAHGRYRLFWEFTQSGKIISVGPSTEVRL